MEPSKKKKRKEKNISQDKTCKSGAFSLKTQLIWHLPVQGDALENNLVFMLSDMTS